MAPKGALGGGYAAYTGNVMQLIKGGGGGMVSL